jgi:hypothetical protein
MAVLRAPPSVILSLRRIPIRSRDLAGALSSKEEYNASGGPLSENPTHTARQPQKHFFAKQTHFGKMRSQPTTTYANSTGGAKRYELTNPRGALRSFIKNSAKNPDLRPIFFVLGDETCTNTPISLRATSDHGRR